LLAAHAMLAWLGRAPGIMTGQDDAQYLILGQSLRQGGYHELFRIDQPFHALYPPGYPAMLAVWGWPSGDRFDLLVALGVVLSVTSLLVTYLALRRRLGELVAVATVGLLAVNPMVVQVAGTVSSEVAYLWASAVTLYFLARAGESAATRRWLVLAGAAAIFAALTRVVGVTLLAAIGLHWAMERRWRAVGWLSLASATTVGAWLVWTTIAPDQHVGVSYAADLGAGLGTSPWVEPLPGRIPRNLVFYARRLLESVAVPSLAGTAADSALALILLGAMLLAGVVVLWRAWRPAAIYLLLYGGLLSVWTFAVGRYFPPITVVLVPALAAGAVAFGRRLTPSRPTAPMLAVVALLGSTALWRSVAQARTGARCDRSGPMPPDTCLTTDQAGFFAALRWTRDQTPPDAVVLTAKYAPFYYYTGRKTPSFRGAVARGDDGLLPFLEAQGASRILYTSLLVSEYNRLLPRLAANCGRLFVERHFPPRTYLFGIKAATDPTPSGDACRAVADLRAMGPPDG
jgi:hypothetical protein